MASPEESLVSVGLDVGSLNARIFFHKPNEEQQQPSIVPNEIGQRYTLALSTAEPEVESDPMNDQYWDNGKNKKKAGAKPPKEVHYLYGDAARKSLQRLKQQLGPHTILTMVEAQETNEEDVDVGSGNEYSEADDAIEENKAACASFFQHLTNLTTNATHTSPHSLRVVLAVPVPSSLDETSKTTTANLCSNVQAGIMKSILQAGINKKDKKEIKAKKRIVTVLSHPIAIAHAHNLFLEDSASSNTSASTPSTSPRDVLVADWGASALSISHLRIASNGIATIEKHVSDASLSGKNIISLLTKHIAELFERKVRGAIPPGETMMNKKAKAKLDVAAEDAIRSFGFSPKKTVTIDGLIEGLDCHVDIMLARFEMLLGNVLRGAETKLKGFGTFDSVISAGSIMKMKCVERMMDRLYPRASVWRGENANDVPLDEAVAIGCARYGSSLLGMNLPVEDNNEEEEEEPILVEEEVPLCPIGIGLCLQEGDPAAVVMIENKAPLPALCTKLVDITGISNNCIHLIQINEKGEEKVVGRIENFDSSAKEAEVTAELTVEGNLRVSVNGGPSCTI